MPSPVVYENARFLINGVDLSNYIKSVALNLSSAMLDNTTMGTTAISRIAGLKDADLTVTPNQDFTSAATVDGTLWGIYNANVDTSAELRPINACSSANNPNYIFNVLLDKYTPMSGNVGTLLMAPFTLKVTGSVSRASSS